MLAAATAAPLLGLLGFHHAEEYRRLISAVHTTALDHTQIIAAEHDRLLTGAQHLLIALSHQPGIRQRDPEACRRAMADVMSDLQAYLSLAAYDLSGRPFCASTALPDDSIANRDFFRQAMATGAFAIGSATRNRASGHLQIPAALPFAGPDGRIIGLLGLTIDLEWVSAIGNLTRRPSTGVTVVIADRKGTVILRNPPSLEQSGRAVPLPPPLEEVLGAAVPGTVEGVGFDGVRRIWGYSPLTAAPKNIFVAAGIDKAAAYAPVYRSMLRSLGISLGVLTLAASAGCFMAWRIVRREAFDAQD